MTSIYRWCVEREDKIKLIYAYVFSPLFIWGQIPSELNRIYGYKATINVPLGIAFRATMIADLPLVLPSSLIRFGYFRRGVNYGFELYVSMLLSTILTLVLFFVFSGVFSSGLGFLDTLVLYCVLTYGSTRPNTIPRTMRYILTILTIVLAFIAPYVVNTLAKQKQVFFPFWEAVIVCLLLHSHNLVAKRDRNPEPPRNANFYMGTAEPEDFPQWSKAQAIELVNIGLAHIGRRTKRMNLYLTGELDKERRRVEYPFLKQLAAKYTDEQPRKALSKHFMLYKEMCLYILYSVILKGDKGLHDIVRAGLKERLSSGLSVVSGKWIDDYVYMFSRAFYDEYRRSRNLSRTLSYTFWSVACEKYPEIVNAGDLPELMSYSGLLKIYRYSYDVIAGAFGGEEYP